MAKVYREQIQKEVRSFYERDDVSRITIGKKETITKQKIKRVTNTVDLSLIGKYCGIRYDNGAYPSEIEYLDDTGFTGAQYHQTSVGAIKLYCL